MKKHLQAFLKTLFTVFLALTVSAGVFAQGDPGTDDDGFFVVIKTPASIARTLQNDIQNCGWIGSTYGPSVTEELCGQVVWAFPDSIACNPLPAGSLSGKIAMVRRGACNFSLKVYRAQQAGAKAVIVTNHYANTADGPCVTYLPGSTTIFGGMSGGDSSAAVVIPSIFIQRETAEAIDGAIKAGQTVEVCFSLPNVANPYVSRAYATPKNQVDSIDVMSHVFFNRTQDTINGVTIKADISGPNGYTNSIETTWDGIPPGYDGLLFFDTYLPPAVPGKYDVVMSNNLYTESRDTLRRSFEITDYTFATDNLTITNAPFNNASFVAGGFIYQTGSLYFTGPNGGTALYATFGIGNIDSLYTGDPFSDEIIVLLYDGDSDEDGTINFQSGGFADIAADVIGSGSYILTGNETLNGQIYVPLTDFIFGNPSIALKPRHPYYLSILYDGTANGSGRCPGFSASANESYLVYDGNGLTTPLQMDNLYSGWGGATLVNRLQMDGFTSVTEPKSNRLDISKFSITPNPANEFVQLNLDLDSVNEKVLVQILTANGQIVRSETLNQFQNGQIRFDVQTVPSGHYLMWIRTAEGQTIQKISICH
jgi:hypothetical protein